MVPLAKPESWFRQNLRTNEVRPGQARDPLLRHHARRLFYGEFPVTRPMTTAEIEGRYGWETGNVIAERFERLHADDIPGVLVYSHGPFVWAPSGPLAIETALALEIIAGMALKSLSLNPGLAPIPQALLDKHFLRKHGPGKYYGQEK